MKKLILCIFFIVLMMNLQVAFGQEYEYLDSNDYVEIRYVGTSLDLSDFGYSYDCKISRANMSNKDANEYFQKIKDIIKNNFSKSENRLIAPDIPYIDITIMVGGKQHNYCSFHSLVEGLKVDSEEERKFIIGFDSIIEASLNFINKKLAPNK